MRWPRLNRLNSTSLRCIAVDPGKAIGSEADRLMQEFLAEDDLRRGLIRLGISFLSRNQTRARNIRTVVNQPIAEEFYETVLRPAWQRLADRFAAMMKEGRLKFADPWTTAMHWKGLNEWDLLERHLLSAKATANPNDIVTAHSHITMVFPAKSFDGRTIAGVCINPFSCVNLAEIA